MEISALSRYHEDNKAAYYCNLNILEYSGGTNGQPTYIRYVNKYSGSIGGRRQPRSMLWNHMVLLPKYG